MAEFDSASREQRPSPDALLAAAAREARGKLRIFLGAAPGVGKTYEMLQSARRRKAEGADVVIGVVETHGRKETQELLEGLEILPRRTLDYQGRQLQEFDLDGRLGTMRFLIHDRDPVFTTAFGEVFKSEGLRIITTLPRTPRMNATCERVIGTLRRELLDRTLILGDRHLDLVLREYVIHYNGHRPHQSRQQRPPDIERQPSWDVADLRSIRRRPVVTGLINEYHCAA